MPCPPTAPRERLPVFGRRRCIDDPTNQIALDRADADAEALGGARAVALLEGERGLDDPLDIAIERQTQIDRERRGRHVGRAPIARDAPLNDFRQIAYPHLPPGTEQAE